MVEQASPGAAGVEELAAGVIAGDRTALARAITLVESRHLEREAQAERLLQLVAPQTGDAHRVGISGPPGVGKSTLIDSLGLRLVEAGHRVAVLAVDPSSTVSGGSILGDKSRMHRLAQHADAFIRPSPSSRTLGGVAHRTREAMALCEAAGYDVVLVETVGVGQSEVLVADMVDTFVVLAQPGSGDELQGIKKGILELADVVAVNKSDGAQEAAARETRAELSAALRYLPRSDGAERPEALAVSAVTGEGLDELWRAIEAHRARLAADGSLDRLRAAQRLRGIRSLAAEILQRELLEEDEVERALREASPDEAPAAVARRLVRRFREVPR